MKIYKTLNGEEFEIEALPSAHQEVWSDVKKKFDESPNWNDFSNFWIRKVMSLVRDGNRRQMVALPIFKICQDLESRLGIEQGYVREGDYRDYLEMLIDRDFPSRYAFCKKAEIDEASLSHILKKRKNFSIARLREVMNSAGYEMRIIFEKKTGNEPLIEDARGLKMRVKKMRKSGSKTRKVQPEKKKIKIQ